MGDWIFDFDNDGWVVIWLAGTCIADGQLRELRGWEPLLLHGIIYATERLRNRPRQRVALSAGGVAARGMFGDVANDGNGCVDIC